VTCSSASEADCAGAKPEFLRPCRSTESCAWQVSAWSACSTDCGEGVQSRTVSCPSGSAEDCFGGGPSAQQACHAFHECTWLVGQWSACSVACGPGNRTRGVHCISGSDADCAQIERPLDQQICTGWEGDCEWSIGEWTSCSSQVCSGVGVQTREVFCPSHGGDAGCSGSRPSTVRSCANESVCQWRVFEWSSCSSVCGQGTEVRNVSCPSGNDADCLSAKPNTSRACSSNAGCTWVVSGWSECNSTCGPGVQSRSVSCTGQCSGEAPSRSQLCYGTSSCVWNTSSWGGCDTQCGVGMDRRTVSCSSGTEEDCLSSERPPTLRTCRSTEGCTWTASGWSLCSSTCGNGTQQRVVRCASGWEMDCDATSRPASIQACTSHEGCSWRTSSWGACSALCGAGLQRRDVWCPSENEGVNCPGSLPESSRSCHIDACNWTVSEWSQCSVTCGVGTQRRNASCANDAYQGCPEMIGLRQQPCSEHAGCRWTTSDWGPCNNRCGSGTRTRQVSCPGGDATWCQAGGPPPESEACTDTTGCQWHASEWASCDRDCGPQTRIVTCPTGIVAECPGEAPASVQACLSTQCARSVGTVRFEAQLHFVHAPSQEEIAAAVASARASVAHILASSPSAEVIVTFAVDEENAASSTGSAGSRRLASTLRLIIEIRKVGAGVVSLFASEAGKSQLLGQLREDLATRGVAASALELSPPRFASGTVETRAGSEEEPAAMEAVGSVSVEEPGEGVSSAGPAVAGALVAVFVLSGLVVAYLVSRYFGSSAKCADESVIGLKEVANSSVAAPSEKDSDLVGSTLRVFEQKLRVAWSGFVSPSVPFVPKGGESAIVDPVQAKALTQVAQSPLKGRERPVSRFVEAPSKDSPPGSVSHLAQSPARVAHPGEVPDPPSEPGSTRPPSSSETSEASESASAGNLRWLGQHQEPRIGGGGSTAVLTVRSPVPNMDTPDAPPAESLEVLERRLPMDGTASPVPPSVPPPQIGPGSPAAVVVCAGRGGRALPLRAPPLPVVPRSLPASPTSGSVGAAAIRAAPALASMPPPPPKPAAMAAAGRSSQGPPTPPANWRLRDEGQQGPRHGASPSRRPS